MAEEKQNFGLQKIYVKDVSFESPQPVKYFTENVQPKINLELNSESKAIDENTFEVILNISVGAVLEEDGATVYLVEIKQAGIFHLSGFKQDELHRVINCHCPNILFPYAREHISSMVERGGFPQLLLAPISFDALYEHHLEKVKQADQNPPTDAKH